MAYDYKSAPTLTDEFKKKFVCNIKGKDTIKVDGLVVLAHEKGLKSMKTKVVQFPNQDNQWTCIASTTRAENRVSELETTLKFKESKREEIQESLSKLEPTSSMTQVYQRVHTAFERINKAFTNAKEQNINNFLQMLETESNKYLQKLNKNDFYGIIRIRKTANNSARIELYSDNGTRIENPNGALNTTMYMSVLFAISQITTLKREQDYPLIFDAPTSSFGGFKEDTFYNVIDTIDKQCVIVTKDLLNINKSTGQKELDFETINKLSCSVYRIEKVEPFNDKDLSTIQTVVKQVR